jgi:hypothetical protein
MTKEDWKVAIQIELDIARKELKRFKVNAEDPVHWEFCWRLNCDLLDAEEMLELYMGQRYYSNRALSRLCSKVRCVKPTLDISSSSSGRSVYTNTSEEGGESSAGIPQGSRPFNFITKIQHSSCIF